MLTDKEYELFKEHSDTIKINAAHTYKKLYEPTIEENVKVHKVICDYCIENNMIIYGGMAQHLLLKAKNDKIYDEYEGAIFSWPDVADIEFYSTQPHNDGIKLAEKLHSSGFKLIEVKEGIHEDTFKIFVNLTGYCDITYMPRNIYNSLNTIKINKFRIPNFYFLLVDIYRVVCDPLTSYWRLDKTISRAKLLFKYYSFEKFNNINNKSNSTYLSDNDISELNKIITNYNLIVIGVHAYNHYVNKKEKLEYIEAIHTDDCNVNIENIKKELSKKYNNIKISKYHPYFQFLDKKFEFYNGNKLLLVIYKNNNRCITYNEFIKTDYYIGTYNLIILHFLINYQYDKSEKYLFYINQLIKSRTKFFNSFNGTNLDDSIFKDFTIACKGVTCNPMRNKYIKKIVSKKKFNYIPSGKINLMVKNYDNISGNIII